MTHLQDFKLEPLSQAQAKPLFLTILLNGGLFCLLGAIGIGCLIYFGPYTWPDFGWHANIYFGLYLVFALMFLFCFGYATLHLDRQQKYREPINEQIMQLPTPQIIIAMALVGIGEEAFFRGFLISLLLLFLPPWLVVLLAAIVFSLLHFRYRKLFLMLCVLVLALFFCTLYVIYPNLPFLMFLHTLYNTFSLLYGRHLCRKWGYWPTA